MPIFSADYASDPAVRRRVMSALWALMTPAVAYLYVFPVFLFVVFVA